MDEPALGCIRRPGRYEIGVRSALPARCVAVFCGIALLVNGDRIHIVSAVVDQSHLHGTLEVVRALGIDLLAVRLLTPAEDNPPVRPHLGEPPPAHGCGHSAPSTGHLRRRKATRYRRCRESASSS